MLKNLSKFECAIEGRLYQLFCDTDSPTGHLKEFIFQISKVIGVIEDTAKAQLEAQAEQKKAQESQEASQDLITEA